MIKITKNIKYTHDLLLLVAHELDILQKYQIKYKLVDVEENIMIGTLDEYEKVINKKFKLGAVLSDSHTIISEILYVENNSLNYSDYDFNCYETTSDETNSLLNEVFGNQNKVINLNDETLYMFYNDNINDADFKKLTYAINDTMRILNINDFYSKENMFEYFLLCDQKTLTNISLQIYDFIKPIDIKTLINIKKA